MDASQLDAIEASIKSEKQLVDFGTAIERLKKNKDFVTVVMQGYFEKEALRLVYAKGDVALQSPESQAAIVKDIDAIGSFHAYLNYKLRIADTAAKNLEDAEKAREEMLAEEQNGGDE